MIKEISKDPVIFLVGNKCDLERSVSLQEIKPFAKKYKCQYFETSCKTGEKV